MFYLMQGNIRQYTGSINLSMFYLMQGNIRQYTGSINLSMFYLMQGNIRQYTGSVNLSMFYLMPVHSKVILDNISVDLTRSVHLKNATTTPTFCCLNYHSAFIQLQCFRYLVFFLLIFLSLISRHFSIRPTLSPPLQKTAFL